jgi:hypothetical protein
MTDVKDFRYVLGSSQDVLFVIEFGERRQSVSTRSFASIALWRGRSVEWHHAGSHLKSAERS